MNLVDVQRHHMKIEINKKILTEAAGFMLGVNKGFHESPLPTFAVKSYSDIDKLKPHLRNDNEAIAHDLGLRLGSTLATKAALGGTVYGLARAAQSHFAPDGIDIDSDQSKLLASIPAIATAWYASDKLTNHLPTAHKKVFGEKGSIYK